MGAGHGNWFIATPLEGWDGFGWRNFGVWSGGI